MGCRYVVIGKDTVTKYGCPAYDLSGGQNIREADVWERVKDTPMARYFAPVLECAPDGSYLVMQRAKPVSPRKVQYANDFYDMVADAGWHEADPQTDNIGTLDGRTVMIDYGYVEERADSRLCDSCIACKNWGTVVSYDRQAARDATQVRD